MYSVILSICVQVGNMLNIGIRFPESVIQFLLYWKEIPCH